MRMSTLPEVMDVLLESRGMTRAEVAKATGVSVATLYRMTDYGKPNYRPSEDTLYTVAIFLGLNNDEWDWLFSTVYPRRFLLDKARRMQCSVEDTETMLSEHGFAPLVRE